MSPLKEFNRYFSKKILREENKLYFKILIITFMIVFFSFLYIANIDYSQYRLLHNKEIKNRYVNLISKLIIEKKEKKSKDSIMDVNNGDNPALEEKDELKNKIKEALKKKSDYRKTQNEFYADLPDEDIEDLNSDEELLRELTRNERIGGMFGKRGITGRKKKDKMRKYSGIYDLIAHPFEYNLSRRGVMYVNIPNDMLREEEEMRAGYRDPDEISRVISSHLPMVEFCFQKARRINANIRGYVKFEFRISYEGYVVPESIRIVDSTIRDPQIEACIKKRIRRWRDFEKLDEKMGIARVVQKFAFN